MNRNVHSDPQWIQLDDDLDEYLHVITRTRPWTKPEDERALTPFARWLHDRLGPVAVSVGALQALARAYADSEGLPQSMRLTLKRSLDRFQGWIMDARARDPLTPTRFPEH
jgi:hypothetical protein